MKEALGISLKFHKIFEEMILKDLGHSFFCWKWVLGISLDYFKIFDEDHWSCSYFVAKSSITIPTLEGRETFICLQLKSVYCLYLPLSLCSDGPYVATEIVY